MGKGFVLKVRCINELFSTPSTAKIKNIFTYKVMFIFKITFKTVNFITVFCNFLFHKSVENLLLKGEANFFQHSYEVNKLSGFIK